MNALSEKVSEAPDLLEDITHLDFVGSLKSFWAQGGSVEDSGALLSKILSTKAKNKTLLCQELIKAGFISLLLQAEGPTEDCIRTIHNILGNAHQTRQLSSILPQTLFLENGTLRPAEKFKSGEGLLLGAIHQFQGCHPEFIERSRSKNVLQRVSIELDTAPELLSFVASSNFVQALMAFYSHIVDADATASETRLIRKIAVQLSKPLDDDDGFNKYRNDIRAQLTEKDGSILLWCWDWPRSIVLDVDDQN